jgi:hypothetical protein
MILSVDAVDNMYHHPPTINLLAQALQKCSFLISTNVHRQRSGRTNGGPCELQSNKALASFFQTTSSIVFSELS